LNFQKTFDSATCRTSTMKNKDFIAMILTHGRPDKVHTYNSLKKQGYTGPICVLIDNEDKTAEQHRKKFGDQVQVFDKPRVARDVDSGDNLQHRAAIVYARNAAFDVARKLGYRYFMQLDDDYTRFNYKAGAELEYVERPVKSLDAVFDALLDFYKQSNATSIAIAQGGDFIGGKSGSQGQKLHIKRKCMNTWICDVEKPFKFCGRMNEDVTTYTCEGRRGHLFMQIPNLEIKQLATQSTAGGMTELYLRAGTYTKSFYTILYAPSCTKINEMGAVKRRLHHSIQWNNAAPKLLHEKWRKAA
jgi:hypothetical protein